MIHIDKYEHIIIYKKSKLKKGTRDQNIVIKEVEKLGTIIIMTHADYKKESQKVDNYIYFCHQKNKKTCSAPLMELSKIVNIY